VRVVYVVLFLYAGINKLLDPRSFSIVIDAFGLVPDPLIMTVAVALPILEILAAVGSFLTCAEPRVGERPAGLLYGGGELRHLGWGSTSTAAALVRVTSKGRLIKDFACPLQKSYSQRGDLYLYAWRFLRTFKPVRWKLLLNKIRYREE